MNTLPTRAALLLALALPGFALAQSPADVPATPDPTDDETIVLSPFEVNARDDDGFNATQSVSGTRTRTDLKNLPMSMQVMTDEFIKATGATDLIDVVVFASGVSQGAGQGTNDDDNTNFTLRGMSSYVPMRNGFRRLRLATTGNIERVEILKGPSSLLYGQLNPGGNVNYITKRPKPNAFGGSLRLEAGSYNFLNAVLDVNAPIVPKKLAMRFTGSIQDTNAITDRYYNVTTLANPSITWWIKDGTSLTAEYERSTRKTEAPRTNLPYHGTIDFLQRPGAVDRNWNASTSDDYFDTEMEVFTVEGVHRFNEHFTLRANYTDSSWYEEKKINGTNINLQGPNLNLLPRRSLAYRNRGSWDSWYQADLVNNFKLGSVGVQNILGYQYEELEFRAILNGTQVTPSPTNQWDIFDPSTWVLTNLTAADAVPAASTGNRSTNKTASYYFTNQLTLLEGRLRTLAGVRYDDFEVESYNRAADTTTTSEAEPALSPQLGVLYKLSDSISLYATYSESFLPIYSTSRRADGTFYNPDPQTGEGIDLGVKTDFFSNNVTVNLAVFQVENTNILRNLQPVTITNPDGSTETFSPTEQSGVERSTGVELDVRWRLTSASQLIFSAAYTDAYVKSDVQNPVTREGHQLGNAPKHTAAFFWRHDFGRVGPTEGVYFTLGARYVGSRPFGDTWNIIDGVATPPPDLHRYTVADIGVGARLKVFDRDVTIAATVKNVFDEEYLATRLYYGAPREYRFSFTTRF